PALQWHGDTFDLPEGAVRLAGSPAYPNQAFRFENAYGVQFHLEVSGDMAREWLDVPEYASALERTIGGEAMLRAVDERVEEMLGEHGFLALTVPEEYGGLGENHVAYSMVCETIARYGCASTAMCYVMHMGAVNAIMLRPTPELIDKYIRPLNSGKIGTLSYSDPETGSHFWYPISSGAEKVNG